MISLKTRDLSSEINDDMLMRCFVQNTVAADPTGKSYASGGEDGYVRVHHFDKGFFDFKYEVERERDNRL